MQRVCYPGHAGRYVLISYHHSNNILHASQASGAVSNGVAKASKEVATPGDEAAELEKRKARAARFGVPLNMSDDKKRELRAQRCCIIGHLCWGLMTAFV